MEMKMDMERRIQSFTNSEFGELEILGIQIPIKLYGIIAGETG